MKYLIFLIVSFLLIGCASPNKDIVGDWVLYKIVFNDGMILDFTEPEQIGKEPTQWIINKDGSGIVKTRQDNGYVTINVKWSIKKQTSGDKYLLSIISNDNKINSDLNIEFSSSNEFIASSSDRKSYFKKH